MKNTRLTRRNAMSSAMALSTLPLLTGAGCATTAASRAALDLNDPAERTRIRTAVVGSTADETIHSFNRMHIYGYMNGGNLQPFFSMLNYNVGIWKPIENGKYSAKIYESGVYTKFDTDEPLQSWENPITGEVREPFHFLSGPLEVVMGPDGIEVGEGATLQPKSMRMEVIGDLLWVPTQSAFSFPNPFKPAKWPKESAGDTYWWDSNYSFSARVSDAANKDLSSIPSHTQFQNMVSWHPWLGMGQTPGKTYGRAFGSKLGSRDELAPHILRAIEKYTPEMMDIENWQGRRNDFVDFIRTRKPT